jgi:hypothetical protein
MLISLAEDITTKSAMQRILHAAELVELIILNLELRDVLRAQRVCKVWRGIIIDNPHIQKALFLAPAQQRHDVVDGPKSSRAAVLLKSILQLHQLSAFEICALDTFQTTSADDEFLFNPCLSYAFEIAHTHLGLT